MKLCIMKSKTGIKNFCDLEHLISPEYDIILLEKKRKEKLNYGISKRENAVFDYR